MNVKELIKLAEEFDQRKKSSGENTEELEQREVSNFVTP